MSNIFIQIASYRDPELLPTLDDCIKQAARPENLVFGIAWQHGLTESLDQYKNDPRFRIIDIPFEQSKGACWARNKIQQLYNGETYTLQLDSHHRFAPNWDTTLINIIETLRQQGYSKPLLTSYVASYDPENDPAGRIHTPWKMNFDRFIPEGAVFFLPGAMTEKERAQPIPARFYSAHFAFADGVFCKEVPHDPEYYFHGEEISIAARAYTWGYDLFHPNVTVVWHEYTRKNRTKQWDDDKTWYIKNEHCHSRNRALFGMTPVSGNHNFGIYGFGSVRTLKDYEQYTGLNFSTRSVQKHTLDHKQPPNPAYNNEEDFQKSFLSIFKYCIDIALEQVPEKDYDFWAVSFHDASDQVIFRKDANATEIAKMIADPDKYCKVWREFNVDLIPTHWVVWPHSISKGWCNKISRTIAF